MLKNEVDSYFIAIEIYRNGIAELVSKLDKKEYDRISIYQNDFRILIDDLSEGALSRILVLYPDPWIKRRHRKRRILNLRNIEKFSKVLKVGGLIYVATDIKEYFLEIIANFTKKKTFSILNKDNFLIKLSILGKTKYEKKALASKQDSFYLIVKKTSG